MMYVPWPTDDVIRRGALARIQAVLESGQDPATVDVPAMDEAALNQGPGGLGQGTQEGLLRAGDDGGAVEDGGPVGVESGDRASRGPVGKTPRDDILVTPTEAPASRAPRPVVQLQPVEQPAVFGGLDLYDPDEDQ